MCSTARVVTTRSGRAPALLALVVAAVALGILGMHALNLHGVTTDHGAAAGPATTMSALDHEAHTSPRAHASTAAAGGDAGGGGGGGHDLGGMVMLCVAMLAAVGLLGLIALLARRAPRVWAHLPAAPMTDHRFALPRLGAGPPPVWEFSVIRC